MRSHVGVQVVGAKCTWYSSLEYSVRNEYQQICSLSVLVRALAMGIFQPLTNYLMRIFNPLVLQIETQSELLMMQNC